MRDVMIACVKVKIPSRAMPTMRFERVGDTVSVYVNGVKVVLLDLDEWIRIVNAIGTDSESQARDVPHYDM